MSAKAGVAQASHRPLPTIEYEEWKDDALCSGLTTEDVWFPEKGKHRDSRIAQDICTACPVQTRCLEYAMANEQGKQTRFGIWGGLTPQARHQLHRIRTGRSS